MSVEGLVRCHLEEEEAESNNDALNKDSNPQQYVERHQKGKWVRDRNRGADNKAVPKFGSIAVIGKREIQVEISIED